MDGEGYQPVSDKKPGKPPTGGSGVPGPIEYGKAGREVNKQLSDMMDKLVEVTNNTTLDYTELGKAIEECALLHELTVNGLTKEQLQDTVDTLKNHKEEVE